MELGINLDYVMKKRDGSLRSAEEAALLCKQAGFLHLDYSMDIARDDYAKEAAIEREIFDRLGLSIEQTHSPMNRYARRPLDEFEPMIRRHFETSAILGAKHVVIHADEYSPEDGWNSDKIADRMYEMFAPHVDFAAKHGMDVAVENLFEDGFLPGSEGRSRYTALVEEIQAVLDRFSGAPVSCCWDFGHAQCAFGADGMLNELRKIAPRVSCTHVHDNYYGKDLHIMPFLGTVKWEEHMALLKEAGYAGKLTYEFVYGRMPDELMSSALTMTHAVGEYLLKLFEG